MSDINGLGPWWFPKSWRKFLTDKSQSFFDKASWEKHDIGYARGNPSRFVCDLKFFSAMVSDAANHGKPRRALFLAVVFYTAVRVGGWASYSKG